MSNDAHPSDPEAYVLEDRLPEPQAMGNPLQRLDAVVDGSPFGSVLAQLPKAKPHGHRGGLARPPWLMFKVLVTPNVCHLGHALAAEGILARHGQIVDATLWEVPRHRNTRAENAKRKAWQTSTAWETASATDHQKDLGGRPSKKGEQRHHGSKSHVRIENTSQLAPGFTVTDAAVHDRDSLEPWVAAADPVTHWDSAHAGPRREAVLKRNQVEAKALELPFCNRPLTAGQKRRKRVASPLSWAPRAGVPSTSQPSPITSDAKIFHP